MKPSVELYTINKNVKCVKCNNKGAIKIYGLYHPKGLGENAGSYYQQYKDSPFMDGIMGPGGTIPHECLNCGNQGLIDFGGLEGFEKAFDTIT